jgi:hypothetical protein
LLPGAPRSRAGRNEQDVIGPAANSPSVLRSIIYIMTSYLQIGSFWQAHAQNLHGWLSDPDGAKLKVATLVARLETGAWPVRAGVSRRSDWRPGQLVDAA